MPANSNPNIINNTIKTTRPIKFIIFLAVIFVVSLAVLLYFVISWRENFIVTIAVIVMCGLFVVLSAFMLLYVSSTYVEINSNKICAHHIFYKKVIYIKKLEYFREKDGVFELYTGGKLFCSFDANDKNAGRITSILEKHGIKQKYS